MLHIFDSNGPLMDVLRKISDIILYNLMFVIFSIPILTAGAAYSALCEGMLLLAEKEFIEDGVVRTFFASFRKHFKEATKMWLVILCLAVLLAGAYFGIGYFPEGVASLYRFPMYLLGIVCFIGLQFAFPLLIKKDEGLVPTIKKSFLLGVAALPQALLSAGVAIGFVYLSLFMRENSFYYGIFFWIAAGFGVVVYINSFFFLSAYKKISK